MESVVVLCVLIMQEERVKMGVKSNVLYFA